MNINKFALLGATLLLTACGDGGSSNGVSVSGDNSNVSGNSSIATSDNSVANDNIVTDNVDQQTCKQSPGRAECIVKRGPLVLLWASPFDLSSLAIAPKNYASHIWKNKFGKGSAAPQKVAFSAKNPMKHMIMVSSVDLRKYAIEQLKRTQGITDKTEIATITAEVMADNLRTVTEKHRVRVWLSRDDKLGDDAFLFQVFYDFSESTKRENLVSRNQLIADYSHDSKKQHSSSKSNMSIALAQYENHNKHEHPAMAIAFSKNPNENYNASKSTVLYNISYDNDQDAIKWKYPNGVDNSSSLALSDAVKMQDYQQHIKGKTANNYELLSYFDNTKYTMTTIFKRNVFDQKCTETPCTPSITTVTEEHTAQLHNFLPSSTPYDSYIIYEYVSLTNGDTDYVAMPISLK